ncbi:MAG TPA: FtsQ-type POTRA domain-containing protein [Candidatus Sulfotelmatobacter sp.]
MARKGSSTIVQEELYPPSAAPAREELDDARLMDLDVEEESPFLRAQKRIPARRNSLPKKTATRMLWASVAALGLCCASLLFGGLYRYGEKSWRFRVDSSDDIEITGMENVTKAQIMEVMGADIGRNIFFIPLAQQKAQLEQIPWVESASVMRFVPNRLQVEIYERTPVAFARVGPRIFLIDARGTLMELPQKHKYSFPVILGMNPGEPVSTRAPRMKAYEGLVHDLDAEGAHYSQDLSEVDLSDLDDIKVRVNDPAGDVLVHLGSSDYLHRYGIYVGHVKEWRQQFQKLESVDLRYDNQIIVNPDMPSVVPARQAILSPAAAKAARAAGVKPAALISPVTAANRALPKPVFEMPERKLNPSGAGPEPKRAATPKTAKNFARANVAHAAPAPERTQPKKPALPPHKSHAMQKSLARKNSHPHPKPNGARPVAGKALPKPSPGIAKEPEITD